MNLQELQAEMDKLRKENEYLKILDSLPPVQGNGMFGEARAPLTDEDRARFTESNRRYRSPGADEQKATEADDRLALAAKVVGLMEENTALKKKQR
jgi:hypothetical protein